MWELAPSSAFWNEMFLLKTAPRCTHAYAAFFFFLFSYQYHLAVEEGSCLRLYNSTNFIAVWANWGSAPRLILFLNLPALLFTSGEDLDLCAAGCQCINAHSTSMCKLITILTLLWETLKVWRSMAKLGNLQRVSVDLRKGSSSLHFLVSAAVCERPLHVKQSAWWSCSFVWYQVLPSGNPSLPLEKTNNDSHAFVLYQ